MAVRANRPRRLHCSGTAKAGSNVVAGLSCELFSFPKLAFSPEAELVIPADRSAMFFPDFPGPDPDSIFAGLCQCTGALFQFFRQHQYPLTGFPIPNPPGEIAVLFGLQEKAPDYLLSIHRALHLNKTAQRRKCSTPASELGNLSQCNKNGWNSAPTLLVATEPE